MSIWLVDRPPIRSYFVNVSHLADIKADAFDLNHTALARYAVVAMAFLGAALAITAVWKDNPLYLSLLLAPAAVLVMTSPRLAIFQFVFVLFFQLTVVPAVPLDLIDASALLVIMAGAVDFLLRGRIPRRLPPLSLNYLYLGLAMTVCGLAGYWPELLGRRLISYGFLIATFFALYRLLGRVSITQAIRWFAGLAVLHAAYVMIPFLASAGEYRSFGFAIKYFDDIAMVALPIAVALYLAAPVRRGWRWVVGALIIMGGLIATHSRAPIAMGVVAAGFVVLVAWRSTGRKQRALDVTGLVRRRIKAMLWASGAMAVGVILFQPEMFADVTGRFEELLAPQAEGSTVYRLELWRKALVAFWDHPWLGVGPGGYHYLDRIYTDIHLKPHFDYTRGMGAHNVLLHYLADMGLVGGLGLLALAGNQYRLARKSFRRQVETISALPLVLYGWAFLFVLTVLVEAGWMWGHLSFLAIFMAAAVARQECAWSPDTPVNSSSASNLAQENN